MRPTQVLRAQHLGFMFKKHWLIQGRRTPKDSGAKALLEAQNLEVVDANELVKPNRRFDPVKIDHIFPKPLVLDETHPDWKQQKCYSFDDSNVLLEGLEQAQVLLKTLTVDRLPDKVEQLLAKSNIPDASDISVRNAILTSNLFDAEQKKLAIRKDPNRPAFVLPRDYGITDSRRMRLLLSKLVFECEKLAGRSTTSFRKIVNDVAFAVPFEKEGDRVHIDIHADTFITSKKPIQLDDASESDTNRELPKLFPLKHTISMPTSNIYNVENLYPILNGTSFNHPHTILLHFSPLDVKNLHGTQVTESQFQSRSLLKTFAVAAASARSKYGNDVKDLPTPTVVQSVQTDGHAFYFACLQLNTLNLDGESGKKNLWFHEPVIQLYGDCAYQSAQPVLTGYNKQVFRNLVAFYKNN